MGCSNSTNDASTKDDVKQNYNNSNQNSQKTRSAKVKGAAQKAKQLQLSQEQYMELQKLMDAGDDNDILNFIMNVDKGHKVVVNDNDDILDEEPEQHEDEVDVKGDYIILNRKQYDDKKKEAADQGKGIIFSFGRVTCGNCSWMAPKIQAFVNKNPNKLIFVKVDIDKCSSLGWEDMDEGSGTLPFIKGYANNEFMGCLSGTDETALADLVSSLVSNDGTAPSNKNPKNENKEGYEIITRNEYDELKTKATIEEKGIIFSFGRPTCWNCNHMAPIIQKLVNKNPNKLTFVKVDIDKCNALGWEDMPKDGKSKQLPFIKGYCQNIFMGSVCGTDETSLRELFEMLLVGKTVNVSKKVSNNQHATTIPGLDMKLITSGLDRHNILRAKHGCPALTHNPELSKKAQAYADNLASRDVMEHSNCQWGDKQVGENLAMCSGQAMTGEFMTDMWYDEIKDYDFDNPGFNMATGHFTQVVWKDTKEVGFGVAKAKSGSIYSVGNYYPPGNYQGQFDTNVPYLV